MLVSQGEFSNLHQAATILASGGTKISKGLWMRHAIISQHLGDSLEGVLSAVELPFLVIH